MSCRNHQFTFEFLNTNGDGDNFEIRPISFRLELNRRDYDYARLKADPEVGDMMKPHTSNENPDGQLGQYKPVTVWHKGDTKVATLLFRPDWVKYDYSNTYIELKDLHKALEDGTIDIEARSINVFAVYSAIVEEVDNDIITDVNFTSKSGIGDKLSGFPEETQDIVQDTVGRIAGASEFLRNASPRPWGGLFRSGLKVFNIDGGEEAGIDMDNISPQRAIERLNEQTFMQSWVGKDRTLNVGYPELDKESQMHICAPDDRRIWRYKSVAARHRREPIKTTYVVGQWEDKPGFDISDIPDEIGSWFVGGKGGKDVRVVGVAERTDVDEGTEIVMENSKVKKDALPFLAKRMMIEKRRSESLGQITINTQVSGNEISRPIEARPGDIIRTVPDDRYWEDPEGTAGVVDDSPPREERCRGFVNNDVFRINSVVHDVSDTGLWEMHLDVSRSNPDSNIDTEIMYREKDGTLTGSKGVEGITGWLDKQGDEDKYGIGPRGREIDNPP